MSEAHAISRIQATVFRKMTGVRAPWDHGPDEVATPAQWAKWNEWCAKDNAAAVRITFLAMLESLSV